MVSHIRIVTALKPGETTITAVLGKLRVECNIKVGIDEEKAYQIIESLRDKYPVGMSWTNANYYAWDGGIS
jgi:hypothetical protein